MQIGAYFEEISGTKYVHRFNKFETPSLKSPVLRTCRSYLHYSRSCRCILFIDEAIFRGNICPVSHSMD